MTPADGSVTPEKIELSQFDKWRIACIGDSILDEPASSPHMICDAAFLLNNRVFFNTDDSFAVSGSNTAAMVATQLSQAIAAEANIILIMGGTNDMYQGVSADDAMENIQTMAEALLQAGKSVILCTIPPREDLPAENLPHWFEFNRSIRRYVADTDKVVLLDVELASTADPALSTSDPTWKSGYSGDGTHPNGFGTMPAGELLKDLLLTMLIPPFAGPVTNDDRFVPNPLMIGTAGIHTGGSGVSGDLADGYTTTGGAATSTSSKAAYGGVGANGADQVFSPAVGDTDWRIDFDITDMPVGSYRISAEIEVDAGATFQGVGTTGVFLRASGTPVNNVNGRVATGLESYAGKSGVIYLEFDVIAATGDTTIRMDIGNWTGASALTVRRMWIDSLS